MEARGLTFDHALELDWLDDDGYAESGADVVEEGRTGRWELVSLVVLLISGTGLSLLGWLVGMALVALSDVWTQRDKMIAGIAGAGAVLAALIVSVAGGGVLPLVADLGPIALIVLFGGAIATVFSAAYLTYRAFVLA